MQTPNQKPLEVKPDILQSILTMQEAQGLSIIKLIKKIEILEDAFVRNRVGKLDKITAQGIVLIMLVAIVGSAFLIALTTSGIDTAIAVFQSLQLFETIIAVYFGLSFNLKSAMGEITDQIMNAVSFKKS